MSEPTQSDIAAEAQRLKAEAATPKRPDNARTADGGMKPQPNEDIAPSGALDAEGHKPVVERSRQARAAPKDHRPWAAGNPPRGR
ncbi:MAG: hypothetical protein LPK04_14010 [Caulobacteraceae bacterium]|nr:hypothetical protein [Caulobacteraceae bacterium]